jgi:hypothetical protein
MQRDMAMRVDDAGQDELARRVDVRVVRATRSEPAIGGADMDDPVTLDKDKRVRDRIAPLPSINVPFSISSRGWEFVMTVASPYERQRG